MKSSIFLLLFSAIFMSDGVQLNINPSTLALSFQKITDYTPYWQSMWTGYDITRNRIYLIGGDRGAVGEDVVDPKCVYYDITNNTFHDLPNIITLDHYAQTHDFTQIGSKMYRMETNTLFIFDMVTETPSQQTITTPLSVTTFSGAVDHIALCTDGNRYLYAVGYNQLYIYDIYNLNTTIQGPTLLDGERQHHSCAYVNDAVYVIGGFSEGVNIDIQTIEKAVINLDTPAAMSFTTYKNIGALRWGHRSLAIGDYIYIIGGSEMGFGTGFGDAALAVTNVDILDTTNGDFYTKTNLVESRFFQGEAMDVNGKIYVFGGARTTRKVEPIKLRQTNEKSNIGINGNCENPLRSTRRRLPGLSSGDPHFTTFNGLRFDFQGAGCYYYMATCPGIAFSLPFALRAQHFQCNTVAKCILELYIDIISSDGSTIIETIDVRNDYTNGTFTTYNESGLVADFYASPFNGGKRNFRLHSQFAKDTDCGYDFELIAWIGGHINVHVANSNCYVCESCGLLGYVNAEGNQTYDMIKGDKLGTLTTNVNVFGYSWYYGDPCTGPPLAPGETHTTEAPVDVFATCNTTAVDTACNALYIEAEFAACCLGWNECTSEIENCKFDTCANLADDPNQNTTAVVDEYGRPSLEFLCARPDAPNNTLVPTFIPTFFPTKNPTPITPVPTLVPSQSPTSNPTTNAPSTNLIITTTLPTRKADRNGAIETTFYSTLSGTNEVNNGNQPDKMTLFIIIGGAVAMTMIFIGCILFCIYRYKGKSKLPTTQLQNADGRNRITSSSLPGNVSSSEALTNKIEVNPIKKTDKDVEITDIGGTTPMTVSCDVNDGNVNVDVLISAVNTQSKQAEQKMKMKMKMMEVNREGMADEDEDDDLNDMYYSSDSDDLYDTKLNNRPTSDGSSTPGGANVVTGGGENDHDVENQNEK